MTGLSHQRGKQSGLTARRPFAVRIVTPALATSCLRIGFLVGFLAAPEVRHSLALPTVSLIQSQPMAGLKGIASLSSAPTSSSPFLLSRNLRPKIESLSMSGSKANAHSLINVAPSLASSFDGRLYGAIDGGNLLSTLGIGGLMQPDNGEQAEEAQQEAQNILHRLGEKISLTLKPVEEYIKLVDRYRVWLKQARQLGLDMAGTFKEQFAEVNAELYQERKAEYQANGLTSYSEPEVDYVLKQDDLFDLLSKTIDRLEKRATELGASDAEAKMEPTGNDPTRDMQIKDSMDKLKQATVKAAGEQLAGMLVKLAIKMSTDSVVSFLLASSNLDQGSIDHLAPVIMIAEDLSSSFVSKTLIDSTYRAALSAINRFKWT